MKKKTQSPSLVAETFMATLKISMIIYLATLAILAVLYFKPLRGNQHVQITQTGNENISQKITNS